MSVRVHDAQSQLTKLDDWVGLLLNISRRFPDYFVASKLHALPIEHAES